jgi:serine/threonine-protein kinase RsbW
VDNQFSLQVKTDLNVLPSVLAWFNANQPAPIPENIWIKCQTALAEGLTNTIRHAHRDLDTNTPILIEVSVFADILEIRIWDHGPAFDLTQQLATTADVIDQNQIGGRGLYLIQRLCDDFSYSRSADQQNCLLLVKHFDPM